MRTNTGASKTNSRGVYTRTRGVSKYRSRRAATRFFPRKRSDAFKVSDNKDRLTPLLKPESMLEMELRSGCLNRPSERRTRKLSAYVYVITGYT